jgi:hypothetical protein
MVLPQSFVLDEVEMGMADPAVEHLDRDIVLSLNPDKLCEFIWSKILYTADTKGCIHLLGTATLFKNRVLDG